MSVAFWCVRRGASRPFISSLIVPSCNGHRPSQSQLFLAINRFYSSEIAKATQTKPSHKRPSKGPESATKGGVIKELRSANSQRRESDSLVRLLKDKGSAQPTAKIRTGPLATSYKSPQVQHLPWADTEPRKVKHSSVGKVLDDLLTQNAPYIYKAPSQRGLVVMTFLVSSFCIGAAVLFTSLSFMLTPQFEGGSQIVTRAYLIVAGFFAAAMVFQCRTPRKMIQSIKVVRYKGKVYFEALVKPYLFLPGTPKVAIIDPLKFSASSLISRTSISYERRKAYEQMNKPRKGASLLQRINHKFKLACSTVYENILLGILRGGLVNIHEKGVRHIGRLDARGYFQTHVENGALLDKLSADNKKA